MKTGKAFTTSYHTRWPEFVKDRMPRPLKQPAFKPAQAAVRRFHAPSRAVMVHDPFHNGRVKSQGVSESQTLVHGVDTDLFRPYERAVPDYKGLPRPILLYFGRVVAEKNIPAFLDLKTTGSKVVIGEGSELEKSNQEVSRCAFSGIERQARIWRTIAQTRIYACSLQKTIRSASRFWRRRRRGCASPPIPRPGRSRYFQRCSRQKFCRSRRRSAKSRRSRPRLAQQTRIAARLGLVALYMGSLRPAIPRQLKNVRFLLIKIAFQGASMIRVKT